MPTPAPPRRALIGSALALAAFTGLTACRSYPVKPDALADGVQLVALEDASASDEGFAALRRTFRDANPGYDVRWVPELDELRGGEQDLVVFLQGGPTTAVLSRGPGKYEMADPILDVGDVVLLRKAEQLELSRATGALVFALPERLPDGLPSWIRPDWDPAITDTPGGCAEETGAYRRILLTWLEEVGTYVLHTLNCHRVRITDSFTHYHPEDGGFDEFYLVQMAGPEARLITSAEAERIEGQEALSAEEAKWLLQSHPLETGDLVYLPRGVVHRGLGGALVQVITVPGFRPGAEIGVDHHIRALNERLGLVGEDALPYREASAADAVVK